MAHTFAKKIHYNPCFWAALWNQSYFEDWSADKVQGRRARDQLVYALNMRADKALQTTVSNVHYDKNTGIAEITPDSVKRFYRRNRPEEYERVCEYLARNPETVYLDFEEFQTGVEGQRAYSAIMKAAKIGTIESAEHRGFLVGAFIIHAMRSHEFVSCNLDDTYRERDRWEYFMQIRNAWASSRFLTRAVEPMGRGKWVLYRTSEHKFPLCDSPIMIGSDSVMVILSPRLLLEIDINATGPVDHWHVRDGISKRKYKEFRIRALRNSFKEILFSDRASLEEWRASPECSDRIRALGDKRQLSRCLREAAARVQWALGGFGRVPVGFEDQIESHFRALNENS